MGTRIVILSAAAVLAGCRGGSAPPAPGQASLQYYTSSVDGSSQPFGLYVPAGYDDSRAHPVVFYGHGYGGSATATFESVKRDFADQYGWLLVNLHGRRISFYDGPGEADVRDVLEWLDANYSVDHSRLFFEGLSMGASGAFRLGARSGLFAGAAGADGWTDFRLWHRHWYAPAPPDEWEVHPVRFHALLAASPLFYAECFERTPLFLIVDSLDTTVWPENGQKLHRRLDELGLAHQYTENNGGHGAGYSASAIYNFFASLPPRDWTQARVKCRLLQHGRDRWLSVQRFRRWGTWAAASGSIQPLPYSDGPPRLRVALTVDNVNSVALYLAAERGIAGALVLTSVNGVTGPAAVVGTDAAQPDLVLDIAWSGGAVSSVSEGSLPLYPPAGPLMKRPQQEGPVSQALCGNMMLVYG